MAWRWDRPLYTLATDDENRRAQELWETEDLGGMTENNNPLPRPIIALLLLTFFTAMAITFPLYGQRPTAAIYADHVALMKSEPVQRVINDTSLSYHERAKLAMEMINERLKNFDSPYTFQREQNPISWEQLSLIAPQIVELQRKGADLEEYIVVGGKVMKANFFNIQPDGTVIAKQPWWDKGYTVAVLWFIVFCLAVIIAVKRLPPYTWQPTFRH